MVRFRVSLRKRFGSLSVEGESEKEVLDSLPSLLKLAKSMENHIEMKAGASVQVEPGEPQVEIPEDIIATSAGLKNKDRIGIILYYAKRSLTKEQLRSRGVDIGVDAGWWSGGNFKRDVSKIVVQSKNEQGETTYRLTDVARLAVRELIEKHLEKGKKSHTSVGAPNQN